MNKYGNTRIIDGHTFDRYSVYISKTKAEQVSKRIKNSYKYVRILKYKGKDTTYKYAIWTSNK